MLCKKCQIRNVDSSSQKLWCRECRLEAKQQALQWRAVHPKQKHDGKSYHSRDLALRELGFSDYREYLRSSLWKLVRTKVFRVKGRSCYLCSGFADMVHHNRYHKNDLIGKNLAFLFPICSICHERIEFSNKGKKLDLNTAQSRFRSEVKKKSNHLSYLVSNYDAER